MTAPSPGPPELRAALDWAGGAVGSPVVEFLRLTGGLTSWMGRLEHADGRCTVLRLVTEQPWRRHGPELVRREAWSQQVLAGTPVPAPLSIAATEDVEGVAAHLMTLVPGERGHGPVGALAGLLAAIHDVSADPAPRDFQSWAGEEKWSVPEWSARPAVWRRAFDVLASGAPEWEPCFLQRDFGSHNLLWTDDRVSGVVDWVETSSGPAWLDVAHGASNLALRHGCAEAERFVASYVAVTGRRAEPFWDVVDLVGFLPASGGRAFAFSRAAWGRLEERLDEVLAHVS